MLAFGAKRTTFNKFFVFRQSINEAIDKTADDQTKQEYEKIDEINHISIIITQNNITSN